MTWDGSQPLSLVEHLTAQFYHWEGRGRGWLLWPYPIELEPPFYPFVYYLPPLQYTDDGRRQTWLSSVADRILKSFTGVKEDTAENAIVPFYPQLLEPEPQFVWETPSLVEFQVALPQTLNVSRTISEYFILNLSSCLGPVGFEIVGISDSVVVQFVCTEADAPQLRQQLKAHFPELTLTEKKDFLAEHWKFERQSRSAIVDFGLSEEFVRPLQTFKNLDIDPLIGLVGALGELEAEEIGIFQVLFQPVRNPWAESILRAVSDGTGKSFFTDAPEMLSMAREKISCPLYAVSIRVAGQSDVHERAWQIVRSLGSSLKPFDNPSSNGLIPLANDEYEDFNHAQDLVDRQSHRSGMILNSDELVCLAHLPSSSVRSEKLQRIVRRTKAAPSISIGHQLLLGENTHNGKSVNVSLNPDQRIRHTYVVGASGTGKSTFLLNLILQDIESGQGIAVLDPHGDLIDQILGYITEKRFRDVILFDPSDEEYPIGFNILSAHSELEKNLLASDLVAVFRRLSSTWGDQMTTVLSNAILAFLESERGGTLNDLRRFLVETGFRREFLQTVKDKNVIYYWEKEFSLLSGKPQAPILTRLDAFLRPKMIRHMVAQRENRLDFAEIMNSGKIFLAKLAQGMIGEENAYLLGTFLVSKFHQLTLSRQELQESKRKPFYLYIDEFHNFITPSMASILSGVRKYRLGLVLAHQDLRQIEKRDSEVSSAALSNPYARVCFRVGDSDARKLADGFAHFEASDLQNLGTGEAIARIERAEYDFNLKTTVPASIGEGIANERRARIIELSRKHYASHKSEVEALLEKQWTSVPPSAEVRPVEKRKEIPQAEPPPKPSEPPAVESRRPERLSSDNPPLMGKGGHEHRYLQQLIKRWAEGMGYRATIEKQLPENGGSVDVALEKDGRFIACEITVTSTPEQELGNIQKCLAAGFGHVIIVAKEEKELAKVEKIAAKEIKSGNIEKVRFLTPENLFEFIESLDAQAASKEETVRGYRVKVNYNPVDEKEKAAKKRAISQVILQAMKRKKG